VEDVEGMISAVAWWWWWLLQLQGEVKVFPTKGTLLRSSSWKVDIRNDSYGSSIFVFSSSNFIGNFVFTKKNLPNFLLYFILPKNYFAVYIFWDFFVEG